MLASLLGEERVAGERRPDRAKDQRLREVIDLGHDVLGGLEVDLPDLAGTLDLELAGARRDGQGERQIGGVRARRRRDRRRHGDWQSTVRPVGTVPNFVTMALKRRSDRAGTTGGWTSSPAP